MTDLTNMENKMVTVGSLRTTTESSWLRQLRSRLRRRQTGSATRAGRLPWSLARSAALMLARKCDVRARRFPGAGLVVWLVTLVGVSGMIVAPAVADLDIDASFGFDEADLGGTREAEEAFGEAMAVGDFDGDGYDDLVVGLAGQALMEGSSAPGAVQVIPGSIDGPLLDRATLLTMDVLWGAGTGRPGDGFGFAVAAGDFNGDGYDDLAVGVPFRSVLAQSAAGEVNVVHGSSAGLDPTSTVVLSQRGPIRGAPEPFDQFGRVLVVGNFDADRYDDLAIGAPFEDLKSNTVEDAGSVAIVYGSVEGLNDERSGSFSQRGPIAGRPEAGDAFGSALAAGDFDGDGDDDLAVGVPDEGNQQAEQIGIVHIINGSPTQGLTAAGNRVIKQAGPVRGSPEEFDQFGAALAAGDFDGDGDDDLAIGAPFETVGHPRGKTDASGPLAGEGTVTVVQGGPNGLQRATTQVLTKKGPIPGSAREGDEFGRTLTSGDINQDGRVDLAIGTAGGPGTNPGEVIVVFGSAQSITTAAAARYGQRGPIPGKSETFDRFGWSIAIGDFSGDSMADIAIGIPGEDSVTIPNVGRIVIVPGQ